MNSKIGIVILNYNTASETIKCIESFVSLNEIANCRVYIVDNGSTDDSSVVLEKYCTGLNYQLIVSKTNLGFSGGNNLGINKALKDGCDWVLLSNSDIIFKSELLNKFNNVFKENPNVCVVGPKIIDLNGNLVYRNQNEEITINSILFHSRNQESKNAVIVNKAYDGMVAGCIFAIRSSFIREANCLDDNVFLYYEEDILLRQIRKYNKFSYICDNVEVVHIGQVSTQKNNSDKTCFFRFYAWPSSVYTLFAYSTTSTFKVDMLIIIYKIYWLLKSITQKQYSLRCKDFFCAIDNAKQCAFRKKYH